MYFAGTDTSPFRIRENKANLFNKRLPLSAVYFVETTCCFHSLLLMQAFVAQDFSKIIVYRNISVFFFHHTQSRENITDIIISTILVKQ
jgi:hypothetical protein